MADDLSGSGERRPGRDAAQTARTVVITLLVIAVALVAAANTDDTRVDLLVEEFTFPLVGLITAVGAAGVAVGFLLGRRRTTRN